MGDCWVPGNLASSTYVWMPLTISGTKATLVRSSFLYFSMAAPIDLIYSQNNAPAWTFADGTWKSPDPITTLSAISDDAILGGSARSVTTDQVGYLGGPENGTLTFNSVSVSGGGRHTVQIFYRNGDGSQRYCAVEVNGISHTAAFSSSGNSLGKSVLHANFGKGKKNAIRFEGVNGGYCKLI